MFLYWKTRNKVLHSTFKLTAGIHMQISLMQLVLKLEEGWFQVIGDYRSGAGKIQLDIIGIYFEHGIMFAGNIAGREGLYGE